MLQMCNDTVPNEMQCVIIYNFPNNLTNSTLWHVIWLIFTHSQWYISNNNSKPNSRSSSNAWYEIVIECCNCISFCASLHAWNILIAFIHIKLLKLLSLLHVQNVMAIRADCKKILGNIFCCLGAKCERKFVKIATHTWVGKELCNVSWLVKWGGNHFKFFVL